jgi:sucrose-6-phosphate hydrolase SacC (GH32 family)
MWLNGHHGFSLAREVMLDAQLSRLLFVPAREYVSMRRAAFAHAVGVSVAQGRAAMSAVKGEAAQLDVSLSFEWPSAPQPGDTVGVSVLGGGAEIVVRWAASDDNPRLATLSAGGAEEMAFVLKAGERKLALRVILDGDVVEAFAQDGRAQVHLQRLFQRPAPRR